MNEFKRAVIDSLLLLLAYERTDESKNQAIRCCSECKHIAVDVNKEPCRECRWSHTDYWEKRE